MSLQPKIRRVLSFPSYSNVPTSSTSLSSNPSHTATAVANIITQLNHKICPTACNSNSSGPISDGAAVTANTATGSNSLDTNYGAPRYMVHHPVLPLIAYAYLYASSTIDATSTTTTSTGTAGNGGTQSNTAHSTTMIVVQDTVTNEIYCCITLQELYYAAHAKGYIATPPTISKKSSNVVAASIGTSIKSLQFYDRYTLFWSRFVIGNNNNNSNNTSTAVAPTNLSTTCIDRMQQQILIVQTDKCILFINLRRGSKTSIQMMHLQQQQQQPKNNNNSHGVNSPVHHDDTLLHGFFNERTLTYVATNTAVPSSTPQQPSCLPSSNILPLSYKYVLIGCNDGTMKVIDYTTNHILKRIKGLGKSDYVIQLISANTYNSATSSTTTTSATATTESLLQQQQEQQSNTPKRIITVTKRGYVYLIEIIIHENTETFTMDVHPPMARLHIPSLIDETNDASKNRNTNNEIDSMDRTTTYYYDPHMDKFYWYISPDIYSSINATSASGTMGSALLQQQLLQQQQQQQQQNQPVVYVWDFKSILRDINKTNNVIMNLENNKVTQPPILKPEPTMTVRFSPITTMIPSVMSNSNNESFLTGGNTATMSTPSKDDKIESSGTGSAPSSSMQLPSQQQLSSYNSKITILSGIVHPAFHEDTVVSISLSSSGDICLYGAASFVNNHHNSGTNIQAAPCMAIHMKQLIVRQLQKQQQQQQNSSVDDHVYIMIEQTELKAYGIASCTLQSPGYGPCIFVATNWGIFCLELPIYSNPIVQSHPMNGNRLVHYGAGLGSYGKSIISVQNSYITYASVDILHSNPVGYIEPKNTVKIYENHTLLERQQLNRPFRYAPLLLQSPSGNYICFFYYCEYRYEIYTTSSLIQQVGQVRATGGKNLSSMNVNDVVSQHRNLIVTSGTGMCDFCWVSDDDVFAVLHATDLQDYMHMNVPKQLFDGASGGINALLSPNLKFINAGMGVASNLAKTVTKTATTTAQSATKLATSAAVTTTTKTVGVTTKAILSGAKGVKKTFGIFGKRKKEDTGGMSMTTSVDDEDDEDEVNSSIDANTKNAAAAAMLAMQSQSTPQSVGSARPQQRYIELKKLELTNIEATAIVEAGVPLATCTSIGTVSLRGGSGGGRNRKLPSMIFGGPVLCVASISDTDDDKKDGYAHFYSRKQPVVDSTAGNDTDTNKEVSATMYQATGPVLPYPDLVVWDDDGRLCAIVVENRVAIYVSNEPLFELLGTVRIGSPSISMAEITNMKFVHGTLFCCTYNSVHCVMIGDVEGGICRFDSYLLASSDIPLVLEKQPTMSSTGIMPLGPTPIPLPLVQPTILGFQSGSLLISTLRGIQAIPLTSPIMRIGLLLAGGQTERATKWFDAVDSVDHEALASFLERRGYPELSLQLPGLSLETIVDISMRYGYVDRLEDAVETYGALGLRAIDMGRGVTPNIFGQEEIWSDAPSIVVSVGAYLLAHGRIELARRLATECLRSGEQGHRDAFFLGALLLPVDESDAKRLIQRAVVEDGHEQPHSREWLMGNYVREFVLKSNTNISE